MFSLQKIFTKPIILTVGLISLFYVFLLPYLDSSFVAINEPDWIERSARFMEALSRGDFASTYQKYHPGVTLMWIVGLCTKLFKGDLFSIAIFPHFAFFTRVVLGTVFLAVLLFGFFRLYRLFGSRDALSIILALFITEPFVMALIRSIGPDSLLTIFIFAFLSFFIAFVEENKFLDLFLCGIFLGLALLTKMTALVLLPVFLVGLLLYRRKKFIKSFLVIILIAAAVFFILFPAMWVSPVTTLKDIITLGVIDAPLYDYASPIISDYLSNNIFIQRIFSYPLVFLFRVSPILLILFLFGIISLFSKKLNPRLRKLGIISLLFLFFYYIPISFADKKIFKYTLPLFIPALFLGFVGLKRLSENFRVGWFKIIFLLFLIIQVLYNFSFAPNDLFYFNPLLGGIGTASRFVKIELETTGFSAAGAYLNSLGIDENTVIATYPPDSLGPFVIGRVEDIRTYTGADFLLVPLSKEEEFKDKITSAYVLEKKFVYKNLDYLFLYRKRQQ